ncbi:MAG: 7-carboxy-7-deazaguanine synthase QueE [Candidatus Omnitrophota bacterium]
MKARIAEIFQSIQGEGIYLGKEQIFIRFYGCNLDCCRFCDTKLHSFEEYEPDDLLKVITSSYYGRYSISLTGGEPLLQKDFLKEFLPLVKEAGFKAYLETNATLADALNDIIAYIDVIAMDFKFPSSTGLKGLWQEHEDFLDIAVQRETFIKAVICNSTDWADLKKATELLSGLNRDLPFILQPNSFELDGLLMNKIQEFQRYALRFLSDVRVVPQMHKLMGVR